MGENSVYYINIDVLLYNYLVNSKKRIVNYLALDKFGSVFIKYLNSQHEDIEFYLLNTKKDYDDFFLSQNIISKYNGYYIVKPHVTLDDLYFERSKAISGYQIPVVISILNFPEKIMFEYGKYNYADILKDYYLKLEKELLNKKESLVEELSNVQVSLKRINEYKEKE